MAIRKFTREFTLCGDTIKSVRRVAYTGCNHEHWHEYYEMILYRSSHGVCHLNGTDYEIDGDCLFLLTPLDFHKTHIPTDKNSEAILIQFTEQAFDKNILIGLSNGPRILKDVPQIISSAICELDDIYGSDAENKDEMLSHLLCYILLKILSIAECATVSAAKRNPIISEAISYIASVFSTDPSLASVASKFSLTPTYFSYLFHTSCGISYKKYLTTLKVEYAKRLLTESDSPIIDVGFECGFSSPSQFERAFKTYANETPSRYRSKNKSY